MVQLPTDQTNDSSNFDRFDGCFHEIVEGTLHSKKEKEEKKALQASHISLHWDATYWMKTQDFLVREDALQVFFG